MLNDQESNVEKYKEVWLSIIVPVYEVERYIIQCLESVVNQGDKASFVVEIIIIDDGSLDNSGKIADSFAQKNPYVRVIHKKNAGVAAARNTGIEEASGEWLYFVDSDDWLAEGAVEKLCNRSREYRDADVILLDAYRNCEEREYNWEHFEKSFIWNEKKHIRKLQAGVLYYPLLGMKTKVPLAAPWDKLFRRNFLLEHQIRFRENLKVLDDMIFCMETFGEASKVAYCKDQVYHYRYVSDSITNSYKPDRVERDKIVWEYLQEYIKRQTEKKTWTNKEQAYFEQAYYSRVIKSYSICCRLCFFNLQNDKSLHEKIQYALDVMRMEPYAEAFKRIRIINLEWKLKIVTIMGRFKFGIGIYFLHLAESKLRELHCVS